MNRLAIISIAELISFLFLGNGYSAVEPLQPGDTVPKIELISLEGMSVSTHPPKDKLLLVSFLKTAELESDDTVKGTLMLYRRFHDSGLNALSVYIDDSDEPVFQLAETWGISWPQLQGKTLIKFFHVENTPVAFLIGQEGKVLAVDLKGEQAHEIAAKHLGVSLDNLPMPKEPVPFRRQNTQLGMGFGMNVVGGESTLNNVLQKAGVTTLTPVKVPLFVKVEEPTIQVLEKNSGADLNCGWYQKDKQRTVFKPVASGGTSKIAIDPGEEPFGIFIEVLYGNNYKWFTEIQRNNGEQHARIYPLKDKNAYLLTWEDMPIGTMDDDFQDIIVRLDNVKPYFPDAKNGEEPSKTFTKEEAIEAIGLYGGFIENDEKGEVESVNLVYGEDNTGKRIECPNDSDTILRYLTAFPDLQGLYIHGMQATDRMMPIVGRLSRLETLMMWDAKVTDEGVASLKNLNELKSIHISNAGLSDSALAILAKLPKLEHLSLQQNQFTDEGLKQLKDATQIKVLWVGLGGKGITDNGIESLLNLKNLEVLDLQRTDVTDDGIIRLKDLPNLKQLFLDESAVTQDGKKALEKEKPGLEIHLD